MGRRIGVTVLELPGIADASQLYTGDDSPGFSVIVS
jgi:hypothetical protein